MLSGMERHGEGEVLFREPRHEGEALFVEEQRFRQPWLWVLVGVVSLVLASTVGVEVASLLRDTPDGACPARPAWALPAIALPTLISAGLIWLFATARLRVAVYRDGLRFRFHPFHRREREIPIASIEEHEACRYSPIGDYGGWGIRGFADDRAYNVRGDRGVRLTLRGGARVLFGSQRPDELAAAIARARGPVGPARHA